MLSNGVHEIIAQVRTEKALSEWFDVVVVSCEVGCVKPGTQIYRACLAGLDVSAQSALFVDDRVVNLRAAEEEGLQTFHFSGDDSVSSAAAPPRALNARQRRYSALRAGIDPHPQACLSQNHFVGSLQPYAPRSRRNRNRRSVADDARAA